MFSPHVTHAPSPMATAAVESLKSGSGRTRTNNEQRISPTISYSRPDSTSYAAALDACCCAESVRQLHAHLLKSGFNRREFVQTSLLRAYGECGRVGDMAQVFDEMPERNSYTYTAALNVLSDRGLFEQAFAYIQRLTIEDFELEFFVFPAALKAAAASGGGGKLELGRQLHAAAVKAGAVCHNYVGNALIDMYGKCGRLRDAEKVFDGMTERDSISLNLFITACAVNGRMFEGLDHLEENGLIPNSTTWTALIGAFVQHRHDEEAVKVVRTMMASGFEANIRVLANVVTSCARLQEVKLGEEIFGYIVRRGLMSSSYVVNALIDMYRNCGDMETAFRLFSRFSGRDEVSFNTMIAGYCESNEFVKARTLFDAMDVSKGLITWNSMISGYVDNSMFTDALRLLMKLIEESEVEPNSFTLGSALGACADRPKLGKAIHSYCIVRGLQSNRFVGGALVDMYCKCRDLEAAERVLAQVAERDVVIWSAFVSGHARCGRVERIRDVLRRMKDDGFKPSVHTWNGIIAVCVETGFHRLALQLFSDMQESELKPDEYTVGIVLAACSRLSMLSRGEQVHAYALKHGHDSDKYIVAALIDMYSKCGDITAAKRVHFHSKDHNIITHNAMLNAYAVHGRGEEGIAFFRNMIVNPDSVSFLAVLSSCVHTGSVGLGEEFFDMMPSCNLKQTLKHYTCMVDLLSRNGQLNRAYKMVEGLRMDADPAIWGALLGGCIMHGNVDMGEAAARRLIELEPDEPGNLIMLANLYASAGKWRELGELRRQMKVDRLHKDQGRSWIEDKGQVQVFVAGDGSHKRAKEVFDVLDCLTAEMRLQQPDLSIVV